MRPYPWPVLLMLSGAFATTALAQPDAAERRPFSFAVLGHIRGERDHQLNPKLGEVLERVRALRPDFVLLTGDVIWGDLHGRGDSPANATAPDTAIVRREWEAVDSALATLGVPVYRVPGNHDISDQGTKRIWWERYGALPARLDRFGARFLLLGSAWMPAEGDTARRIIQRPGQLDSAQTAWLRAELGRSRVDPTFLVLHHLLWWEPSAPWWSDLHPLLAPAGVRVVFAGDYGPLKFSHLTRDSVRYVQASMEGIMRLRTLRELPLARMLSAQFDTFLFVKVAGSRVDVQVEIAGEWSSPQYTPAVVQAMLEPSPSPPPGGWRKWADYLLTPRKLAAAGLFGLLVFLAGLLTGRAARKAQ